MNKRTIFEQADDVVSQVDALVETYIAANQDHPDRIGSINEMREGWLKVIRECEAYNILHCRENEVGKEPLQKNDLFKKFCFLFKKHEEVLESGRFPWRLIVIPDTHLSPSEVLCFEGLMKIIEYETKKASMNIKNIPFPRSSFERLFTNLKSYDVSSFT
jgi:hypothetical protein